MVSRMLEGILKFICVLLGMIFGLLFAIYMKIKR